MSRTRHRLPDRRENTCFKLTIHTEHGREKVYLHVGCYADGRVGEVFVVIEKTGAQVRALIDEIARGVSRELQCGWTLEELIEAWRETKFMPAGSVVGHEQVKLCTSPLDAVARVLEVEYGQANR